MAARFVPSAVVIHGGAGHTTLGGAGGCLFGIMDQFFVLGLLPTEGTRCNDVAALGTPFGGVQLPPDF